MPQAGFVEDFEATPGTVALTLDVDGVHPSTCIIDACDLDSALTIGAQLTEGFSFGAVVTAIADHFKTLRNENADFSEFDTIGYSALWTAMNHPTCGEATRDAVSEALRERHAVHLTWYFADGRFAVAMGARYVNIGAVIKGKSIPGRPMLWKKRREPRDKQTMN